MDDVLEDLEDGVMLSPAEADAALKRLIQAHADEEVRLLIQAFSFENVLVGVIRDIAGYNSGPFLEARLQLETTLEEYRGGYAERKAALSKS